MMLTYLGKSRSCAHLLSLQFPWLFSLSLLVDWCSVREDRVFWMAPSFLESWRQSSAMTSCLNMCVIYLPCSLRLFNLVDAWGMLQNTWPPSPVVFYLLGSLQSLTSVTGGPANNSPWINPWSCMVNWACVWMVTLCKSRAFKARTWDLSMNLRHILRNVIFWKWIL